MTFKQPNCFVLCMLVTFVGCSNPGSGSSGNGISRNSDPEQQIIGRWSADPDASKAKWGDDEELARRMTLQLDVEWEFKPENRFVVHKGERSITGRWKTKAKDNKQIQVEVDSDADPTDKRVVLTLVLESDDRIVFSSDEAEGEMVLCRKQ